MSSEKQSIPQEFREYLKKCLDSLENSEDKQAINSYLSERVIKPAISNRMLNKIDWEHAKLVTIENVRKNEDISNFFPLKRELIINDKIEIVDDAEKAVVGTSTKLEKSYFRLTSAVDESNVRPLRVLERAFVHCIGKYEKTKDYLWVRDQLKAIRQDLKVQNINGDFTNRVYEKNFYISLDNGDAAEVLVCVGGASGGARRAEFDAYRTLRDAYAKRQPQLKELLHEKRETLLLVPVCSKSKCYPFTSLDETEHPEKWIDDAMEAANSLISGDWHNYYVVKSRANENMKKFMQQHDSITREMAFVKICQIFKPTISLKGLCELFCEPFRTESGELSQEAKFIAKYITARGAVEVENPKDKTNPLFKLQAAFDAYRAGKWKQIAIEEKGERLRKIQEQERA